MVSPVHNDTTLLLGLAIEAASLRQQAIAHNIANANVPGAQRLQVSFEQRVAQALAMGADFSALHAQLEQAAPLAADSAVALDMEMAALSQTTVHHQALLKALSKQYSLLSTAINEGKR